MLGKGALAASVQTLFISFGVLGINLLTGIITARYLGAEGRGQQEAMGLWPLFLAQAFTLGLPSALVYYLKKTPAQAPKIFSAALLGSLLAGGLAVIVGVVFIPLWLNQHDPEVVGSARVLMLFAPALLLDDVYQSALRARGDFALYNLIRFLRPSATLLGLVTLALFGLLTPLRACLCYLVPGLPLAGWLLGYFWRSFGLTWTNLSETFKSLFSYGLRSYGIDLLSTLSFQLDKALVVGLVSASGMGLYTVSLSLANMLSVFQGAAVTVLFPHASGRSEEEVVAMAGRAARISLAVTVTAAVGLSLVGPWVLELLYGSEFRGAANLMRILIVVTIFEGTASVLAQAFMATNRPGLIATFQGIGLSLNLPLLLLLVPRFGLIGAGSSLLISSFVRLVFVLVAFPLILKRPVPSLWLTLTDIQDLRAQLLERFR